jgi:acyl carrier protein
MGTSAFRWGGMRAEADAVPGTLALTRCEPDSMLYLMTGFAAFKRGMADVSIDNLKRLLVQNCMVKIDPETITKETLLFGPEGIGLDSLDALQMSIAIEKEFNLSIGDPNTAREALQTLGTLADWITAGLGTDPK